MNVYTAGGDKQLFPGLADQHKTKKSDLFFLCSAKSDPEISGSLMESSQ